MAINISDKKELNEKIKDNEFVFLDFFASWCGPCISFSPIYEKISSEFSDKAVFLKINIDEQRDLAIEYRISSIPTILCLKKGIVFWTHTGGIPENNFREKVTQILS